MKWLKFLSLLFIPSISLSSGVYNPGSGSGGGGGGSGTINPANQFDVPYYSSPGSTTTLSGYDNFKLYTSSAVVSGSTLAVNNGTVSANANYGLVDIYSGNALAAPGQVLLSIGSRQQADQLDVIDQSPLNLSRYGMQQGALLNSGTSNTVPHNISDVNSVTQFINWWNNGEMDFQTATNGNGGKNMLFSPQTIPVLKLTSTGVQVISSMTITGGGGVNTTYNVTAGSLTLNNVASGVQCLHADGSGNVTGTGADCGSGSSAGVTWASGTIHQVLVNQSSGSVKFGTPQDIDLTSNVEFASVNLDSSAPSVTMSTWSIKTFSNNTADNNTTGTADNLPQMSVSFWALFTATMTNTACVVVGKGGVSSNFGWDVYTLNSDTNLHFHILGVGTSFYEAQSNIPIRDNAWHNIVVTYDKTIGAIIYIDGLNHTGTITGTLATNWSNNLNMTLNGTHEAPGDVCSDDFPMFDEFAVYPRVLLSTEAAVIAAGATLPTGATAYFHIEEGAGNVLNDATTNGNKITEASGPYLWYAKTTSSHLSSGTYDSGVTMYPSSAGAHYNLTWPPFQGSGAPVNDGAGNLAWTPLTSGSITVYPASSTVMLGTLTSGVLQVVTPSSSVVTMQVSLSTQVIGILPSGNLPTDVMYTDTNQTVSGIKTFTSTVTVTGSSISVNGVASSYPSAACAVNQVLVSNGGTAPQLWSCQGQSGNGGGVVTYSGAALTFSGTIYFPAGGGGATSGTEANVDVESPSAATLTNFYVQLSGAVGAGNSETFTWRKNGADTSVTCAISGASATTCNDTSHSFTVSQGDLIDIKAVASGTIVASLTTVMMTQFGTTGSNGTVNNGNTGQMAYYAANGTAVSGAPNTSFTSSSGTISESVQISTAVLAIGGALIINNAPRVITGALTLSATDSVCLTSGTAAGYTVTLPPASNVGQFLDLIKVDNDSYTITYVGNGTDQIQSTGTYKQNAYLQSCELKSIGTVNGIAQWIPWGQGCENTPAYLGGPGGAAAQAPSASSDVIHYPLSVSVPVCINGYRANSGGTASAVVFGIADMNGNNICNSTSVNSVSGLNTYAQSPPCCLAPGNYLRYFQERGVAATFASFNAGSTSHVAGARTTETTYPTGSFTPNGISNSRGIEWEIILAGGSTF